MIGIDRATWTGREWLFAVNVHEGVYQLSGYPVHLTYLGPLPEGPESAQRRAQLSKVIERVVAVHLRKGSLPPRGLVVNWRVLVDDAFSGDALDPVRDSIATVDAATAVVSDGEGHGYFHPFYHPRPNPALSADVQSA